MSSVASWFDGLHDGHAVARSCAVSSCEAVHVSTVDPSRRLDALTALMAADGHAALDGWCGGLCPEHAEAAS